LSIKLNVYCRFKV